MAKKSTSVKSTARRSSTATRTAQTAPPASARSAAPVANTAGRTSTVATDRESQYRDQDDELKGTRKDDAGRLLFWARRPFGYGGKDLDRGQKIALTGLVNDQKLNRLGYIVPLLPTDKLFPCRYCDAEFVDLNTLNAHGDKRHANKDQRPNVPLTERGATVDETAGEAEALEREQGRLEREAPLNLDKAASARA